MCVRSLCFISSLLSEICVFSKKLQFSLLNNQDTVKLAEFEVTHRDLYTPIDRLSVKNGVLDRRLVRYATSTVSYVL